MARIPSVGFLNMTLDGRCHTPKTVATTSLSQRLLPVGKVSVKWLATVKGGARTSDVPRTN